VSGLISTLKSKKTFKKQRKPLKSFKKLKKTKNLKTFSIKLGFFQPWGQVTGGHDGCGVWGLPTGYIPPTVCGVSGVGLRKFFFRIFKLKMQAFVHFIHCKK